MSNPNPNPNPKEITSPTPGAETGNSKTASKQKEPLTNSDTYKYTPFSSPTTQIRLFRISHLNALDAPTGHLETFTHNDAPAYQALSYTWGSETPLFRLPVVDPTDSSKGGDLQIRRNLESFLRVFGKKKFQWESQRWIWIDQLCINQDDMAERNAQVQRMGEIYAQASEVVVWLEPDAATDDVYDCFGDPSLLLSTPAGKATLVAQLIENAYFDRLWVVQEMVLAKALKIHYRDVVLDWGDLCAFLNDPPMGFRNHTMKMKTKWLFQYAAGATPLDKKVMPLDTLQYFCSSGCQDPRDVVYALQTMWEEGDRQRVDYSRRTTTIFIELTLMLLTKFLGYQGLGERRPSFILAQVSTNMELDVQGCRNYAEREAFFKAELNRVRATIEGGSSSATAAGMRLWQTLREKLVVNPEVKKVPNQGSTDPAKLDLINKLAELELLMRKA